jgi:uncharacterized YigZ family protein
MLLSPMQKMNLSEDSYFTISKPATGIYKEKGSKFLAFAYPVSSEEKINEIIKAAKKEYHDARHHCYAWNLQGEMPHHRINDDGEPSGTAGKPILGQINANNLNDILIIVVRYFGGVLLGTGGLTKAYKLAAADAIENSIITKKFLFDTFILKFNYTNLNTIIKRIEEFKGEVSKKEFEMDCIMEVNIRKSLAEEFVQSFNAIKENLTIHEK